MTNNDRLDALLRQRFSRDDGVDDADAAAGAARVLARLAAPLPAQRQSWRLWPAALLDWNFAPAWPRLSALACCGALGFVIGVAGPALRNHHMPIVVAQNDDGLGAVLSEPEPLTGVLP